jgi:glycosyltransferase involved in cell wall biosynthesis
MFKTLILMPLAEQRGGAELALLHLLQSAPPGIFVVVFLEDGPMVAQAQKLGASAYVVQAPRVRHLHRLVPACRQIAEIARREQVSTLFSWMSKAHLYGCLAAALSGLPALWYQHGIPHLREWRDWLFWALPNRGILACSRASAEKQRQFSRGSRIAVVYPSVELDRFDPERLPPPDRVRTALGLPVDGPLVGIVGRLQRWKGMHVLVEAMPEVLRHFPDCCCVVVGGEHALEPDYPQFLRDRIAHLGLEHQVRLVGLQRNVHEWMQAMDVVVHASDNEPFGIVVLEAMALGKPLVAGASGGPTEVITDGKDGLLVPFGDAPALARAICRYLAEPEFARRTGTAARSRAQDFSLSGYAERFESAVHSLLV